MSKTGGREPDHSRNRNPPLPDVSHQSSSSTLDETDVEILSHIKDNPLTILDLAEKVDISFVESLRRTRRLQDIGLLERIEDSSEGGLYRYLLRRDVSSINAHMDSLGQGQ